MNASRTLLLVVLLRCSYFQIMEIAAQPTVFPSTSTATISKFTEDMEKQEGLIDLYWDSQSGKIWMAIPNHGKELLYYPSLAAGLGSNDIGLDRGRVYPAQIVRFIPVGDKLLLQAENYTFRASAQNLLEKRAVEESFAASVIWGFKIAIKEDDRILVDGTDFFLQDVIEACDVIKRSGQGNYKTDLSRSAIYKPRTKSFPENTEIEATITYIGEQPGNYIRQIVPVPKAISLRIHHSFVALPEAGFDNRTFDPRAGVNAITYFDYSSPINQDFEKKTVRRHRLVKKDPSAALSEVVKPIIYYIDPGTPEPIRTALMEGTAWWAEAFEAAGFKNAFQVKLLPEDADPMDVRYNLVQWVHRSSRGWSYGGGVTDPRTGEILKGKVTLGSLRVRQDYLIAQALAGNFDAANPENAVLMDMALARMRQLAAHEVGHTLGLPHNYIASAKGLTSVMDYPHPYLSIKNGAIDLSNAYEEGIGSWDIVAIKMAYASIPEGLEEQEVMDQWVGEYLAQGLDFLSDKDGRPAGSAHPKTHLWDNGTDPVAQLAHVLEVRKIALDDFGLKNISKGMPLAKLEELLVPIYLLHRYQVEAASKVIAGVNYGYTVKGDARESHQVVSRKRQLDALNQLLQTLKPETLSIPLSILQKIPPRPYGYAPDEREVFKRHTGLVFDPLAPAEIAAHHTLTFLFHPERASRLVAQSALDVQQLRLDEYLDDIIEATWKGRSLSGYSAEIKRSVEKLVLQHLMELATNPAGSVQVRAISMAKAMALKDWIGMRKNGDFAQIAHRAYCLHQLKKFQKDSNDKFKLLEPLAAPAGSPIGQSDEYGGTPCFVY